MIKIIDFDKADLNELFIRSNDNPGVEEAVTEIIQNVRKNGDAALKEYEERFDKAKLDVLEVTREEIEEAKSKTDQAFLEILKKASRNIYAFHQKQVRQSFIQNETSGVVCGQKIIPIEKVGLYIPGGTAALSSSVLMNCIPAKIAGCACICMVTPPGPDGKINQDILAAADIAGVDRIFKVGGAQAIAALAYGTESIPAVDKIVGPGNAYVAEAKKQVYGKVAIDMIAGPSEILIVADRWNDPFHIAVDLLSQAEHDKMATAVLVTDDAKFAQKVSHAIEYELEKLPRKEIARASIDNNGKIIVANNIDKAFDIVNLLAPEHLEICANDPFDYLDKVKNAGSVFLGKNCPEALGDYYAGPNHTLPTSGSARFSSPLSVDDFVKKMQYTYYTRRALADIVDDVETFAEREGLSAHGRSVRVRCPKERQ